MHAAFSYFGCVERCGKTRGLEMGKKRGTWASPASFIRFPAAHVSRPFAVIKPYHPEIFIRLPFLPPFLLPLLAQRRQENIQQLKERVHITDCRRSPRSHGADSFPEACLFVGDTSENVFDESTDPEHLSLLVYHRVYMFIPGYMRDASQVRRPMQKYPAGTTDRLSPFSVCTF